MFIRRSVRENDKWKRKRNRGKIKGKGSRNQGRKMIAEEVNK